MTKSKLCADSVLKINSKLQSGLATPATWLQKPAPTPAVGLTHTWPTAQSAVVVQAVAVGVTQTPPPVSPVGLMQVAFTSPAAVQSAVDVQTTVLHAAICENN